jgi:pimeloyl-ACP methyl ester carboxylesterase
MILVVRPLAVFALLIGFVLVTPPSHRGHSQTAPAMQDQADIYLLRGLFNIYSLGMDSLAEKLRAQGYAPTVTTWDSAAAVADRIIADHRKGDTRHLILIGHSLGSNAVVQIANQLAPLGIAVDLAVTFDVTEPLVVPANVERFINFYQRNGFGREASPAPGFTGEFSNLDLTGDTNLSHTNIDESPRLQAFVMNRVYELMHAHVRTVDARRKKKRS